MALVLSVSNVRTMLSAPSAHGDLAAAASLPATQHTPSHKPPQSACAIGANLRNLRIASPCQPFISLQPFQSVQSVSKSVGNSLLPTHLIFRTLSSSATAAQRRLTAPSSLPTDPTTTSASPRARSTSRPIRLTRSGLYPRYPRRVQNPHPPRPLREKTFRPGLHLQHPKSHRFTEKPSRNPTFRVAPRLHHSCTKTAPRCTKVAPRLPQTCPT